MCKRGANARGSLKKFAVFAKNVIICAKMFAKTERIKELSRKYLDDFREKVGENIKSVSFQP
jgi:hypothetical protein